MAHISKTKKNLTSKHYFTTNIFPDFVVFFVRQLTFERKFETSADLRSSSIFMALIFLKNELDNLFFTLNTNKSHAALMSILVCYMSFYLTYEF